MPDPLAVLLAALLAAALLALGLSHRAGLALRSRLGAAEAEARHGAKRAEEAERLHASLRAEFQKAHDERREIAAREERLGLAVGGLEAQLGRAAEERAAIGGKLDKALVEVADLRVANERLEAAMDARVKAHEGEVALLRALREEMGDRFRALADETLRTQGETFGQVNRERIEALMTPMREQVSHFQAELRAAHEGAAVDRQRLKTEIDQLTRRSEAISQEAVALTRALKGDKQRQGAWGEMVLGRLLEESGLCEGREVFTQHAMRDEDGNARRRADVLVAMPQDRWLVIDAKVSLVAYEAAVNAEEPAARDAALAAHVRAVRDHIDDLATRGYHALRPDRGAGRGSVDYVVMFMPIEGALAAALGAQGDLTAYALRKGVGIATPMTLMLALRTVEHVWSVERRQTNAQEIARRGGLLYDKVAGFAEAMEGVRQHLARAQGAHEEAMGRLTRGQGNLLRQAEMLKGLGAETKKAMPIPFDGDEAPAIEAAE